MKGIQRIENDCEGDGSLESPLSLLLLAKESIARIHEMIYSYQGIGCREESVKLEIEFPPEEQDDKNPNTIHVSSIPFQITSGGVTVKSTMRFSEVVKTGLRLGLIPPAEVEKVDETNGKNNKN